MQPVSDRQEDASAKPAHDGSGGRADALPGRPAAEDRLPLLPLAATLAFHAVLLASFIPAGRFEPWLFTMLSLVGLRALVLASRERVQRLGRRLWLVLDVASTGAVGAGFGISTLWVDLPGHFWVLAILNLWLGGLSCAALMLGQGSARWHALAFALPAKLPLQASGDWLRLTTGLGNLFFFAWLLVLLQRKQRRTLGDVRHRAGRGACGAIGPGRGAQRPAAQPPVRRDRAPPRGPGRAARRPQSRARCRTAIP